MFFLFVLYFLINILFQGFFSKLHLIDVLVFSSIIIILLLVKINVNYFLFSMKIMLILSIIYALGSILLFTNMELYSKLILNRFSSGQKDSILRLYSDDSYAGLTSQTAYIAGYLVYGIAIAVFIFKKISRRYLRNLVFIAIPLMLFSLILSSKRAHLLFMIIALIITFIFSTEVKKIPNQI